MSPSNSYPFASKYCLVALTLSTAMAIWSGINEAVRSPMPPWLAPIGKTAMVTPPGRGNRARVDVPFRSSPNTSVKNCASASGSETRTAIPLR